MEGSPLPVTADVDDGRPAGTPGPGRRWCPPTAGLGAARDGPPPGDVADWSVDLWTPAVVKIVRPGWSRSGPRPSTGRCRPCAAVRTRPSPGCSGTARADAVPFIAVEYLDGPSLDQSVTADGPLPAGDTARLGVLLLGAVRSLHAGGTAHLDVSPDNVLLVDRRPG